MKEPASCEVFGVMSCPRLDFEVEVSCDVTRIGATVSEAKAFVDGLWRGDPLAFATGSDEWRVRWMIHTVLMETSVPVWSVAPAEYLWQSDVSIRLVLCSVDLIGHSRHAVTRESEFAAAFGARLMLVHVTPSVEIFGPGGSHLDPELKRKSEGFATDAMNKLQNEAGTCAEANVKNSDTFRVANISVTMAKALG